MKKKTKVHFSRILWGLVAISGLVLLIFTLVEKHCDKEGHCTRAIPLAVGIPVSIFMMLVGISYTAGLFTAITDSVLAVFGFAFDLLDTVSGKKRLL